MSNSSHPHYNMEGSFLPPPAASLLKWRDNVHHEGRGGLAPASDEGDGSVSEPEENHIESASDGSDSQSGYESDWEKEVTESGEVFFVVPREGFSQSESLPPSTSLSKDDDADQQQSLVSVSSKKKKVGAKAKSGKLSRLVRRRESKRDRILGQATSR